MTIAAAPSRRQKHDADMNGLLESVAKGDRTAFRQLYDASASTLFGIAMRLMRNREAAQDVLQEAMTKIWQKAHLFDSSKGNAIGWMVVVTRNCALSRMAQSGPSMVSIDDATVQAMIDAKTSYDPGVAADIRRCLKMLSDRYRECVTLTYLYGLSYDELATRFGAPLGTIKSWIHRAAGELALCLEK